MFIGILAITAAILLSVISAIFSINGIITIFSGAALGAGIMGGVLEFSKISATIWLYSFWKKANTLLKTYFIVAIVILILISTLGIFGFLAKAYVGQGEATSQVETQIERVNRRISREESDIEKAQKQLDILDEAVDRYLDLNIITRGIEAREEQREDREKLNNIINESENNIAEYEERLFTLKEELNTLEVNVGPIKYIASLLYGEDKAEQYYDTAARILIILIVIVFDPFAVLLMVAGNVALDNKPKKKVGRPKGSPSKKKVNPSNIPNTKPQESVENKQQEETNKETPPKIHKRRKVVK